jgi:CheY-like chemotaxis protein
MRAHAGPPGLRETLVDLLQDHGYPALAVQDGHEALAILAAGPLPSLILLDLEMPRMNGWVFREAQRRDPRLASIPVILLSHEPNLSRHARSLDICEYLSKPLEATHLLERVGRRQLVRSGTQVLRPPIPEAQTALWRRCERTRQQARALRERAAVTRLLAHAERERCAAAAR